MSDKNIDVIKHIQATGKCPEDIIMATSMYSESGYQPEAGKEFKPKKSMEDIIHNYEHNCKYEYNYVDMDSYANVDVDSNSLFDSNEKNPAMKALNMIKEYCRVSLKELYEKDLGIKETVNQQKAYVDVIDFIEDHQRKCKAVQNQSSTPTPEEDFTLKHIQNERDWFHKMMNEYSSSFFKICDIVEHSDCANIIKKLINEEKNRY